MVQQHRRRVRTNQHEYVGTHPDVTIQTETPQTKSPSSSGEYRSRHSWRRQRWPRLGWFGEECEQPVVQFRERRLAIAPGVPPPRSHCTHTFKHPHGHSFHTSPSPTAFPKSRIRGPTVYPRTLIPAQPSFPPSSPCQCCALPPPRVSTHRRRAKSSVDDRLKPKLSTPLPRNHSCVDRLSENLTIHGKRLKEPSRLPRTHSYAKRRSSSARYPIKCRSRQSTGRNRQPSSPVLVALVREHPSHCHTFSESSTNSPQSYEAGHTVFADATQEATSSGSSDMNDAFSCGLRYLFKSVSQRSFRRHSFHTNR